MIKIKDEVDLKELEKFGFEADFENTLNGEPTKLVSSDGWVEIELYDDIDGIWNTRVIYVLSSAYLDSIYDLIQAGLVEKVGD